MDGLAALSMASCCCRSSCCCCSQAARCMSEQRTSCSAVSDKETMSVVSECGQARASGCVCVNVREGLQHSSNTYQFLSSSWQRIFRNLRVLSGTLFRRSHCQVHARVTHTCVTAIASAAAIRNSSELRPPSAAPSPPAPANKRAMHGRAESIKLLRQQSWDWATEASACLQASGVRFSNDKGQGVIRVPANIKSSCSHH